MAARLFLDSGHPLPSLVYEPPSRAYPLYLSIHVRGSHGCPLRQVRERKEKWTNNIREADRRPSHWFFFPFFFFFTPEGMGSFFSSPSVAFPEGKIDTTPTLVSTLYSPSFFLLFPSYPFPSLLRCNPKKDPP